MQSIIIQTEHPYEVCFGSGLLPQVGKMLRAHFPAGTRLALVTDSNVNNRYAQTLSSALRSAGFSLCSYVFPAGEHSKNLSVWNGLVNHLSIEGLRRQDAVVALGGGVTGDLAGFAAATYLRGIQYIQIPTTILAAVDSSVGGKTAVNLPSGKNLAGAFHQPSLVICDTDTFDTLPERERLSGFGEIIKYAWIRDPKLTDLLLSGFDTNREEILSRCLNIKKNLIEEDERDHGIRRLLNFGHTLGQALEAAKNYEQSHGQCVAAGMVLATEIAEKTGFSRVPCSSPLKAALASLGLSYEIRTPAEELCLRAMHDKKRSGSRISMILPRCPGLCEETTFSFAELHALVDSITSENNGGSSPLKAMKTRKDKPDFIPGSVTAPASHQTTAEACSYGMQTHEAAAPAAHTATTVSGPFGIQTHAIVHLDTTGSGSFGMQAHTTASVATPPHAVFGLVGKNVNASLSPALHRFFGGYEYALFSLDQPAATRFFQNLPVQGINITMPYKQAVIPFCSRLTPQAAAIGAVNTAIRLADGSLLGHNTDYFGFCYMMDRAGISVRGKKVLIFGSGGAFRAALACCKDRNAGEILCVSRSAGADNDLVTRTPAEDPLKTAMAKGNIINDLVTRTPAEDPLKTAMAKGNIINDLVTRTPAEDPDRIGSLTAPQSGFRNQSPGIDHIMNYDNRAPHWGENTNIEPTPTAMTSDTNSIFQTISYDDLWQHRDANILINATPLGMTPDTDHFPVCLGRFPNLSGVLDAVYTPSPTMWVRQAQSSGIPASGGLSMLAAQAKEACEWFLQTTIPRERIEDALADLTKGEPKP